jgi:glycosyltransferase involved in cell wall biosynthesis
MNSKLKDADRPLVRRKVLYITYDGLLEPLGESQVLRYQTRLAKVHKIVLVSFEKSVDWQHIERREALRKKIIEAGITWIPLRYHKRPSALATAYDIAQGVVVGIWAVVRYRVRIVHARSYVPSVMALALKKIFRLKHIFDMRGFWADERVDGGLWPAGGRLYRVAKWFERRFLLNADCVVSLTQAAVDEMMTFPYLKGRMPRFEVITTCADLDLFKPAEGTPSVPMKDRPFTLGYVGSVGVWYLFDETLRCFQLLRERLPNALLHILNRGEHDYILERLHAMNIDPVSVQIDTADHAGVARAMQHMDAGFFFIKSVYSKTASAPTKLGEFLGCGVPCLGNAGVGDMAAILANERVGVALIQFDESSMREAIDRLLQLSQEPDIKVRCREVAVRYFSLNEGVRAYDRIYCELGAVKA